MRQQRTEIEQAAYKQYLGLLSYCADMRGQPHASVKDSIVSYGSMAGLDADNIYWDLRFEGLVKHEDALGATKAVFKDWQEPDMSEANECEPKQSAAKATK